MKYTVSFTQIFVVEADNKEQAIFKGRFIFNNPASIEPIITVREADKDAVLSKNRYEDALEKRRNDNGEVPVM